MHLEAEIANNVQKFSIEILVQKLNRNVMDIWAKKSFLALNCSEMKTIGSAKKKKKKQGLGHQTDFSSSLGSTNCDLRQVS